jgi:hypothetical protein
MVSYLSIATTVGAVSSLLLAINLIRDIGVSNSFKILNELGSDVVDIIMKTRFGISINKKEEILGKDSTDNLTEDSTTNLIEDSTTNSIEDSTTNSIEDSTINSTNEDHVEENSIENMSEESQDDLDKFIIKSAISSIMYEISRYDESGREESFCIKSFNIELFEDEEFINFKYLRNILQKARVEYDLRNNNYKNMKNEDTNSKNKFLSKYYWLIESIKQQIKYNELNVHGVRIYFNRTSIDMSFDYCESRITNF